MSNAGAEEGVANQALKIKHLREVEGQGGTSWDAPWTGIETYTKPGTGPGSEMLSGLSFLLPLLKCESGYDFCPDIITIIFG